MRHCNAAMREGDWKLVWPWIAAGRLKDDADTAWYLKGMSTPHALMDVDPTLPERSVDTSPEPLLFNLREDPYEAHDLARQHPDRVSAMRWRWDTWFDRMIHEWDRTHEENVRV
jgi:hypothetical protein